MNRQQIVAEIKRIAIGNGGQAPGRQAFERATAVKMSEWYPHIWLRWGDAVAEAGYAPNLLQAKASDEVLIEKYIAFARQLGRFPVGARFGVRPGKIARFRLTRSLADLAGKTSSSKLLLRIAAKGPDLRMCWRFVPNASRELGT